MPSMVRALLVPRRDDALHATPSTDACGRLLSDQPRFLPRKSPGWDGRFNGREKSFRVPGSHATNTYGREVWPIFQTRTVKFSGTFPNTMRGLPGATRDNAFTCWWLRAHTCPKRHIIGNVSPGQWTLP